MKKLSILLTLAMLICPLTACGNASTSSAPGSSTSGTPSASTSGEPASSKSAEPSKSTAESAQTAVLYAVFGAEDIKEYPIEYTGTQKTAEELADELTGLTGLDFTITASKADDGWIVDWDADSTLVAGLDDREQKKEFTFSDQDSMRWFMMDSLWRTLSENLDTENIYYTMDGGQELVFEELYPVNEFPADIPYMGSGFYDAHADVKGDEESSDLGPEFYEAHAGVRGDEESPYAHTKGLWRMDGAADTASIEMDGFGGFTMYDADGSVEADGHLECADANEYGDIRYDCYTAEGEWIVSFYFDSATQIHMGNEDEAVYILDTQTDYQGFDYQGFWEYPDGTILEINEEGWNLYEADELTPYASGPVEYDGEAAYLMNDDGSSGGGKVYFDEDGNLVDSGNVLTYHGGSL